MDKHHKFTELDFKAGCVNEIDGEIFTFEREMPGFSKLFINAKTGASYQFTDPITGETRLPSPADIEGLLANGRLKPVFMNPVRNQKASVAPDVDIEKIAEMDKHAKARQVILRLGKAATRLISLPEIDARLGYAERQAVNWLREHGIGQVLPGFAVRRQVLAQLRTQIPLGMWRRKAMGLSLEQVEQGAANLSEREWDLVRCWIPRRRRSRQNVCDRAVVNAAIWITATGRRWKDLPVRYGNGETCYGRYRQLKRAGAFSYVVTALQREHNRTSSGEVEPFVV